MGVIYISVGVRVIYQWGESYISVGVSYISVGVRVIYMGVRVIYQWG